MKQEFIRFNLDIPKEREDLIDFAKLLFYKIKNLSHTKIVSDNTSNSEDKVIVSYEAERLKKFDDMMGSIEVASIPTDEERKEIRFKKYVK